MSKGSKSFLVIVVIVLLVLGIVWAVYENYKTEPANINATTDLPDENKGIDNIINDFVENEMINTVEEANVVEDTTTDNEEVSANNSNSNENSDSSSSGNSSEVVEGTSTSREERAIELAKEYYEEEYGNSDDLYFSYEGVNGEGKHIVRASSNAVNVAFLIVDLNTGLVTEK